MAKGRLFILGRAKPRRWKKRWAQGRGRRQHWWRHQWRHVRWRRRASGTLWAASGMPVVGHPRGAVGGAARRGCYDRLVACEREGCRREQREQEVRHVSRERGGGHCGEAVGSGRRPIGGGIGRRKCPSQAQKLPTRVRKRMVNHFHRTPGGSDIARAHPTVSTRAPCLRVHPRVPPRPCRRR